MTVEQDARREINTYLDEHPNTALREPLLDLRQRIVLGRKLGGGQMFLAFHVGWILYDACALDGEKLTDAAYRFKERHPVAWTAILLVTHLHLQDAFRIYHLPWWTDPYVLASTVLRLALTRAQALLARSEGALS